MKIKKMELKLDANGNVVLSNGMPVYAITYEDGNTKEEPFNASQALMKISDLNNEAKTHRLGKEKAEGDMTALIEKYEDLDPEAAKKALETVKNLDESKLLGPEKVQALKDKITEELKGQFENSLADQTTKIKSEFESKLQSANDIAAEREGTITELLFQNHFNRSNWFVPMGENEAKTIFDPEIGAQVFRNYFKVEGNGTDAKLVGYIGNEKIASLDPTKIAQTANFDEAIEQIFNHFPPEKRNRYLKASNGGAGGGDNFETDNFSGKTIVLSKEDAKNPEIYNRAREAAEKSGGTVMTE